MSQPFDPWDSFPFHRIDTPSFVQIRRTALEVIVGWLARNPWSSDVQAQAWFQLASIAPMVRNGSATAAYRVQPRQGQGQGKVQAGGAQLMRISVKLTSSFVTWRHG